MKFLQSWWLIPMLISVSPSVVQCTEKDDGGNTIIGGTFATERLPWYVNFFSCRGGQCIRCGGSLIREDTVLTAARCVRNDPANIFAVHNALTINGFPPTSDGTTLSWTGDLIIHPDFNGTFFRAGNDIAMFKVNPVDSSAVIPLNFDPAGPSDGQELHVYGHGQTIAGQQSPSTELKTLEVNAEVPCIDPESAPAPDLTICALSPNPNEGPCNADFGGPLVTSSDPDEAVQVGILSAPGDLDGACAVGVADIYTDVQALAPWIADNVCDLSDFGCLETPEPMSAAPSSTPTDSRSRKSKSDDDDEDDDDDDDDFRYMKILTVKNLAFGQPFSPFFVMSHDSTAMRLFELGTPATEALADLAENGIPHSLVDLYTGMPGVAYAGAFMEGAPYLVGQPFNISVPYEPGYDLITIASMAINTNDCFVAMNGANFMRGVGSQRTSPGYDAGSEENNENCESIPGPGCPIFGNVASGNGEGVVHIHRGFFGIGDLLPRGNYDWRNPMMSVELVDIEYH